jgi:hypothetical protein
VTVYERHMAQGAWDLKLRDDTPKSIRDFIEPYSHVVILVGDVYANRLPDSAILDGALYTGVVLQPPGRDMTVSGAGLGWWLGDSNGQGAILTSLVTSPLTGSPLSDWVTAFKPASLAAGTVTSPGGNVAGAYQWVTRRQALDGICAAFGVEWRIRPNFKLDVATFANLFGSTPSVIAQRRSASSGSASGTLVGLDAEINGESSYDEWANTIYLQGRDGPFGAAGGSGPFRDGQGNLATIIRMVDAPNVTPGTETAVATSLVAQYSTVSGQRKVDAKVNRFAITTVLKPGAQIYLYDPEFGLSEVGASPLRHNGSAVFAPKPRAFGIRWPVQRGMSILVRYWDDAGAAFRYANLTPYVEFETGTADLEIA